MKKPRPYAVDTDVPATRTRGEIETMLKVHGATKFFYGNETTSATLGFALAGLLIRISMPIPIDAQGERSAWRALLLIIKAKLEAIRREISTVEREFLADIVTPDGETIGELLRPQLAAMIDRKAMPRLTFRGEM